MQANRKILESYRETVAAIFRLAATYPQDVSEFKNIFELYNFVRALEYRRDPPGKEFLSRFFFTKNKDFPIRDCDDKTLPLISYAIMDKIPDRIVVCGVGDDPHHVYPELFLFGSWIPTDATFPNKCILGKHLYKENFRQVFYR